MRYLVRVTTTYHGVFSHRTYYELTQQQINALFACQQVHKNYSLEIEVIG